MYQMTDDDEFAKFAQRAEMEAEQQRNRSSGFTPKEYDQIEWVGLDEKGKIVRIVGGLSSSMSPGSHSNPTDAHELFISRIIDDNGKRMKLKLPLHVDEPTHEHIMWRIINAVNAIKWNKQSDGKSLKTYINQGYPWFDKVNHGGYEPTDRAYQYSKGWKGQQVIIMNVIDREDNWCVEHKHTKLLSKKITVGDDGTVYADDGVPSFGFCSELSKVVGAYGSWEKYDLQIKRTGQMQQPVEVKQATVYKKNNLVNELNPSKVQFISLNETLTPEELSYERYDIDKLYAPTSYQKLLSRLGNTIKAIDADLKKNFYEELQGLAEKEKADWEAAHPDGVGTESLNESVAPAVSVLDEPFSQPISTPASTSTPTSAARTVTRPVSTPASGLSADKIALLKGWSSLNDAEKAVIVDVEVNPDGTLARVVYKPDCTLVSCPETFPDGTSGCKFDSPDFFTTCPVCGKSFN